MNRRTHGSPLALVVGVVLVAASGLRAQEPEVAAVDFARQVLPVLSNKCFVCHGPDSKQGDLLRLDSYEGATRDLGGYRAIDPADLGKSRIPVRIHDAADPMPPRDSGKTLTQEERELITRWIQGGGKYAKHWAFVPPRKRPPTQSGGATGHPVDGFVLAGLRDKRVELAPAADRGALARRAALVLTGLPPEPATLSRFLSDANSGAYGRLLDELMSSTGYGEHQARYWLDAVRYGDTHGLHLDNRRGIYPYRDWVVQAFNDNLPLDDFITWQLAGDLLPEPTVAQQVATGFVRMNPSTAEGGAIPAEFQAKNTFDRTETFGTVMLGMTMTCARCHTHKYDPIEQEEYYRLSAFFNSTAEPSMDGNRYAYAPVVSAPANQADWKTWNLLESEMMELVAGVDGDRPPVLAHARASARWSSRDWMMSKRVTPAADAPGADQMTAVKGLPGVKRKFTLKADQAVWVTCSLKVSVNQTLELVASGAAGSKVWLDGELLTPARRSPDPRSVRFTLSLSKGTHALRLKLVGAKAAVPVGVQVENPWQVLAKAKAWDACSGGERLRMIADPRGPVASGVLQRRAADLARRVAEAKRGFTTSLVARDLPKPRATRVLSRGEYDLPTGDPLEPGVPKVMGSFPPDAPRNRLGLARWLTQRSNPLVARVLVNRIWQRAFGAGLVRTPEDFGLQGQHPTHPRLLDWLAVELQESGWDMKHMLRLMLTSRTFKQRSVWRGDIDDPENRWLARGPRYRLDAEVVRDIALWGSGLLDPHMGGEGVKPYQPGGLWSALAHPASNTKRYVQDPREKLYRRSLYVYWKRTSPHPMMILFDAPSREASCVVRSRTNTPLQSLALFNETQRLEMSRVFAQRLLREAADDRARINRLFTLLASRDPTPREQRACEDLVKKMRERYAGAEEDAAALLDRPGHAKRDESTDPAELAAWSQLVITVLASDIAIMLY